MNKLIKGYDYYSYLICFIFVIDPKSEEKNFSKDFLGY